MTKRAQYTVFQARAGDHNNLAMPGAKAIGEAFERRTGVAPMVIGTPEPALNTGWREELNAALPALKQVQARFDDVLASGAVSIAATSRCAVSLALFLWSQSITLLPASLFWWGSAIWTPSSMT